MKIENSSFVSISEGSRIFPVGTRHISPEERKDAISCFWEEGLEPEITEDTGVKSDVSAHTEDIGEFPLLSHAQEIYLGKQIFAAKLALRNLQKLTNLLSDDRKIEVSTLTEKGRGKYLLKDFNREILSKPKAIFEKDKEKKDSAPDKALLEEIKVNDQLTQSRIEGFLAIQDFEKRRKAISEYIKEQHCTFNQGSRAYESFCNSNLGLVKSIAKKFQERGVEPCDLVQEGSMGLEKAVRRYDYRLGLRFSTNATWWIRQSIMRAISDKSSTIRIPIHAGDSIGRIYRKQAKLRQEEGRDIGIIETAKELGENPESAEATFRARQVIYLETPINEDGTLFGDTVADKKNESVEDQAFKDLMREKIEEVLNTLSPPERNAF